MIFVCIVNVFKNRNNSLKFICNSFKRVVIRNLIILKGNVFVSFLSFRLKFYWYLI